MTEPDSSDPIRSNPLSRVPRWWWLSLAALVAIRALLPIVLERAIPWFVERATGAQLEIENIDLGLFGGYFGVEGLRVASPADSGDPKIPEPHRAPAGSSPSAAAPEPTATRAAAIEPDDLLSLDRLQLEIDWLDLLGAHVNLPLIRLDGLTLRLHQNRDGSFALPTPLQAEDETTSGESTPSPPSEVAPVAEGAAAPSAPHPAAPDSVAAGDAADAADGWQISIGRLELNQPDLALHSERTGSEVAHLTLTRFAVDALTSGPAGFGLGDIALEQPAVFVERDWLFDPGLAGGAKTPPEKTAGPPALQIARLALNSGNFQIRSAHGPIESAIRIEILRFDTARGRTFPIEIALDVGEGSVGLNGQLGIFPPFFEGELSWRALRVPPYLLLTRPAVAPWLVSCNAEGRVDLSFRSQAPAQLVVRGETRVSDLVFRQPETGELALEIQQLSMQLREAIFPLEAGQPRRVDVAAIEIAKPKAVFTNPPDALDELLAILSVPPQPEEPASDEPAAGDVAAAAETPNELPVRDSEAGAGLAIAIEKLKLSDGELVFVDRSVKPRHETRIRDFRLDAAGVTSPPGGAEQIELAGLIQARGTFDVKGKLPGGKGSLRVEVQRLDLASYSGFAQRAGLNLESGDASLESSIRIGDGRFKAENDLVLHQLRVDATNPSAFASTFGISLDLALALLRGPRGDIALALPVTFDKSGAGVGMAALIRSALREALKGALASPFKLVGGLLPSGSKPASFEPIAFGPGEIGLNAAAKQRIAPLVDLLEDRPGLGLTVRGQTASSDEPSLALAVLRERALAGEGLPELDGAGFFARRRLASALRERAEGGTGALDPADEALLSRYVEAQEVPAERIEAFAKARAQAVVDALAAAGAPAAALTIGAPERAEAPGVVIGFGLRARDASESPS